jgi:hypothetical protein
MLRIAVCSIWILFCSVQFKEIARSVFGVRVAFQANSSYTTFVCFLDNGRVLTNKRVVSQDEFIKIVSGYWPSIYNPKRINYFEERNIGCGVAIDSFNPKLTNTFCPSIDSLWKIRFSTYPYRSSAEDGWSNKLHKPSPAQEIYLYNNYGIRQIDADFFLDTNFWKLMNDVVDPTWIRNYKSLR